MTELPVKSFSSARQWASWLRKNHDTAPGIWLRLFKKDSGVVALTYAEALDEALCYGWIDGQVKKHDEASWIQKFTPRTRRSLWSRRNVERADKLVAEGRMQPAGLQAIEAAKADGRWTQAYDSPKNMTLPEDFLKALAKDKKAYAFFETLNKANRYAIAWRLQTAKKPETREKRMKNILEMMSRGEKFH